MKNVYLLLVFNLAIQLMAQTSEISINGIDLKITLFKTDSLYEIIFKITNPYTNSNKGTQPVYLDTCNKFSIFQNTYSINIGTNSCFFPFTFQSSSISYLTKLNEGESYILRYKFTNPGIISNIDLNFDFIRFLNQRKDIFFKKKSYKVRGDFFSKRKYEGSVFYIHHSLNI